MTNHPYPAIHQQCGAATLVTGLILLTGITLLSLGFSHTQVMEQRVTSNALRSSQSLQAADGGLEFGRAWLSRQRPDWIDVSPPFQVSIPGQTLPRIVDSKGTALAISVAYQRSLLHPRFVLIRSDAQPGGYPGLRTTVQAYARPQTVLATSGESAPPLVIGGCINSVSGIPDIYPVHARAPDAGAAIASSRNRNCLATDPVNMHGGRVLERAFAFGETWGYMFRISKSEMQTLSDTAVAAGTAPRERAYWWATASDLVANTWQRNLGSPDNPVVLVIPADLSCPRLAAGVVIYGVVYIEGGCDSAVGRGTARVYGTLAVEGDLELFSPELRLAHISHASGNPDELKLPLISAPLVPGTWKDF